MLEGGGMSSSSSRGGSSGGQPQQGISAEERERRSIDAALEAWLVREMAVCDAG